MIKPKSWVKMKICRRQSFHWINKFHLKNISKMKVELEALVKITKMNLNQINIKIVMPEKKKLIFY